MKRLLVIIHIVLCSVLTAFAEQIKVSDITLSQGGSATVEMLLDNEHTNIVAFQMDLTLPKGISIDKTGCKLSSRITDMGQGLLIGKLESGAFRLISTSMSLSPIYGTEGALLILKLYAEEDFVKGQAVIDNICFSTSESERITIDNVSFAINTKYKLTYMVDDEIYKTFSYDFESQITPEAEPMKEGYIFSGWSEIPETMPAEDVVVTGTFTLDTTGIDDVNSDDVNKEYYNLNGVRIAQPTKGVNIMKMSDGSTRKVLMK